MNVIKYVILPTHYHNGFPFLLLILGMVGGLVGSSNPFNPFALPTCNSSGPTTQGYTPSPLVTSSK